MTSTGGSTHLAAPRLPLARTLKNQLRHLFGLGGTITIGQVRYRELTAEPLRHALSRKGPGRKEYDAHFPEGPPLRISATARRVYADLAGPRLLPVYERSGEWMTPGLRVLLLEGGTGYAAAWAAERVGPSGAVVSLDRDEESAAFARRRYPLPNVAFERGGIESLGGETEGSFDAVLAVDPFLGEDDRRAAAAELWRVVGPGGWLFMAVPLDQGSAGADLFALVRSVCEAEVSEPPPDAEAPRAVRPTAQVALDEGDGWAVAVARRPEEE